MQIADIDAIVQRGIKSLNCSLDEYWPQSGKNNGLPERNLSLHVGHSFLQKGWYVYSEAAFPMDPHSRLDMLAIAPDLKSLVAVECKQLYENGKAKGLTVDGHRLHQFNLTKEWDGETWKAPRVGQRFGLLLATAWRREVADWWKRRAKRRSRPSGCSGRDWSKLGALLRQTSRASAILLDKDDERKHWALYAIMKL